MNVKIYICTCTSVMVTIIPTKELNFIVNDFLYMYYLISKYSVGGGGIWQIITKIQFLRIVRIYSLIQLVLFMFNIICQYYRDYSTHTYYAHCIENSATRDNFFRVQVASAHQGFYTCNYISGPASLILFVHYQTEIQKISFISTASLIKLELSVFRILIMHLHSIPGSLSQV